MTFKAVFPDNLARTDPDMGVLKASEAVSGRNILILPIYASVLRRSRGGALMTANVQPLSVDLIWAQDI
jgi:hypothetical protein